MPSEYTLHLTRHILRKEYEAAIRRGDSNAENYATALEEICELKGRAELSVLFCHLAQNDSSNRTHMGYLGVIGASIGFPTPAILDFKAAAFTGVSPKSADNGSAV